MAWLPSELIGDIYDSTPDPPPAPVDTGYPGSTANTPVNPGAPAAPANVEGFGKLNIDKSGLLANANGLHVAQGHLMHQERVAGGVGEQAVKVTFGYWLGDKEWDDEPLRVVYAGEDLDAVDLADGDTPGYHFWPGEETPSDTEDTYAPGLDLIKPHTPAIFVRLPDHLAVETQPDKVIGIYQTRKLWQYTDAGVPTTFTYSANTADRLVDGIRQDYEIRLGDPAAALVATQASVDWQSYADLYNYCAGSLSWNDGAITHTISRFECHTVFTGTLALSQYLDAVCATACARWQFDGEKYIFRLPTDQTISHIFGHHNTLIKSIQRNFKRVVDAPRHLHIRFRDIHDPLLNEKTEKQIERADLVEKFGEKITEIVLPSMTYSQAQRIGQHRLRMETDNLRLVQLSGAVDSLRLLPGDFCAIDLQIDGLDGNYLVLKTNAKSPQRTPDECGFLLQKIEGDLYSDSDHLPIEEEE